MANLRDQITKAKDTKQVRLLIDKSNNSLSEKLASQLLEDCRKAAKRDQFSSAVNIAWAVAYIGLRIRDDEIKGRGFFEQGKAHVGQQDYENAVKAFQQAEQTFKLHDHRSTIQALLAEVYYHTANALYRLQDYQSTLEQLHNAAKYYRAIGDMEALQNAEKVGAIVKEKLQSGDDKPPTIEEQEKQRNDLSKQVEELQSEANQLRKLIEDQKTEKVALTEELETLRVQVDQYQRQTDRIQQDIQRSLETLHFIRTSTHAPMWVAAAQVDLQNSKISPWLIPLLDQLMSINPTQVNRLQAEIAARLDEAHIPELDSALEYDREYKLHWSVARAKQLNKQERLVEAAQILVDAWEEYLRP